jgi:predicted MFS family arabinose efflux permease
VVGLLLFAVSLVLVMLFLISLTGQPAWWWLVAALPVVVVLVRWERRTELPFLDIIMLGQNPALLVVLTRQLLVSTAFYAVFYVLRQWLEAARHYSPVVSGLFILPITAVGVGCTVIATRLIQREHLTATLLIGNLGLVLAGVILAVALGGPTPWWGLVLIAILLGIPTASTTWPTRTSSTRSPDRRSERPPVCCGPPSTSARTSPPR